jgi:hypothetical protein
MTASLDARFEPRHSGPKEEREVPALSGAQLLALHNAGRFRDVIARLLAQSTRDEVARVRSELMKRAAGLRQSKTITETEHDLFSRLRHFAAQPIPAYLDEGTADGLLCLVLLLTGGRAPSLSTVHRDLHSVSLVKF